jgi:GT2 family glycosyltransferase
MKTLVAMVSIYESGEWLEARLENLKKCTLGEELEVWCVNANSPDLRDHEIPQKFDFKYVKLDKRNTVYEAWNYILENSDSKYVTNANTDDLVKPECYTKLISAIENSKDVGFSYCNWYVASEPNGSFDQLNQLDKSGRPGRYAGDLERAGVGHFPLWKRDLHTRFGLFDTQFKCLADADWWARCYHVGKVGFSWVDEFLAIYLWRHGENLWNKNISAEEWQKYHTKVAKYKKGKLA